LRDGSDGRCALPLLRSAMSAVDILPRAPGAVRGKNNDII
jgi:hypothetical protein